MLLAINFASRRREPVTRAGPFCLASSIAKQSITSTTDIDISHTYECAYKCMYTRLHLRANVSMYTILAMSKVHKPNIGFNVQRCNCKYTHHHMQGCYNWGLKVVPASVRACWARVWGHRVDLHAEGAHAKHASRLFPGAHEPAGAACDRLGDAAQRISRRGEAKEGGAGAA